MEDNNKADNNAKCMFASSYTLLHLSPLFTSYKKSFAKPNTEQKYYTNAKMPDTWDLAVD